MTDTVTVRRSTAIGVLVALAAFASFTVAVLKEWSRQEPRCVSSVTVPTSDGARTTYCTCRDGEKCSKR